MNTAQLKTYAPEARNAFIAAVSVHRVWGVLHLDVQIFRQAAEQQRTKGSIFGDPVD